MSASKRKVLVITGSAAAAATPLVATGTAEAATFTVTNLNDSGAGSLRDALDQAKASAGPDTVVFQAGLTGTIVLLDQLRIGHPVTIDGPGASVISISGDGKDQVLYFYNVEEVAKASIVEGVTIIGGNNPIGGGVVASNHSLTIDQSFVTDSAAEEGGGVAFRGSGATLVIRDSEISGNTAERRGGGLLVSSADDVQIVRSLIAGNEALGSGGGIFVEDTHGLTIIDSTIDENEARRGGGIYLYDNSTEGNPMLIDRSTISGNTADDAGGGLFLYGIDEPLVVRSSTISDNTSYGDGGGIYAHRYYYNYNYSYIRAAKDDAALASHEVELVLEHSTVAYNYAEDDGGGIFWADGSLRLDHTIVADNDSDSGQRDLDVEYYEGMNVYADWSVIDDHDATLIGDDNTITTLQVVEPALADNGGPTKTHLPVVNGPAFDAGDPDITGEPATDQRGRVRVENIIEIGAVELGLQDDEYTTAEDTPLNVAAPGVVENDDLYGDAEVVTGPSHGTVTLQPDGSFLYTPAANFNGDDSFTYRRVAAEVTSLAGTEPTATVVIHVTPVNDPPVAQNDNAATVGGVAVAVAVKTNDSDADNDPLTIVSVTQGTKGTVVIEGNNVRYTPAASASGIDTFTYTISDGTATATATVTVTITPPASGPRIPDTGNSSWSLVFTAAGMLGAGALLAGIGRRRRPA